MLALASAIASSSSGGGAMPEKIWTSSLRGRKIDSVWDDCQYCHLALYSRRSQRTFVSLT